MGSSLIDLGEKRPEPRNPSIVPTLLFPRDYMMKGVSVVAWRSLVPVLPSSVFFFFDKENDCIWFVKRRWSQGCIYQVQCSNDVGVYPAGLRIGCSREDLDKALRTRLKLHLDEIIEMRNWIKQILG
jgi:hypothetical protein